jgi:hypothetical protein
MNIISVLPSYTTCDMAFKVKRNKKEAKRRNFLWVNTFI